MAGVLVHVLSESIECVLTHTYDTYIHAYKHTYIRMVDYVGHSMCALGSYAIESLRGSPSPTLFKKTFIYIIFLYIDILFFIFLLICHIFHFFYFLILLHYFTGNFQLIQFYN